MSRRIALIVGVSQYDKTRTELDSLAAPVNDAQAVYEVLHQYGGFDTLYPLPLGTEGVDASGFVPSGELVERLAELLNPQAGDEVELAVIYFSGHGVSERGQVVYLSASDERLAVAVPWLADLAKHSAVKNVCLWLDCCHSGEVLKFADLGDKGFCVVAASHADGEALALDGRSLLTELLCKALTPGGDNGQEIRVLDFVQAIEAGRKNLPQQVLCRWGDSPFTLTQLTGEVAVDSLYPPDHAPYKGLLTFTQADREFFFGRDGMIQQLLDKLSANRFVPLLGASGSGKSSLVLAGLLPKLPESDWQVLVMRPTAQPLQNLRDTLVRGFPDAQVGTLASGADLQREVLRLVMAGKRLLLVIDQFEEVFTECRDDAARAAFFTCLLEALDGDNPLHLVLTLRADFLGHCTEQAYSGLGQRLQHHALLLVAPTAGELREAITRPLALVGMRCEQALEDELVDQTLHAKGSLPLLQYVLEKLWQSARQERSRELTQAMYQQLGGQHGGGLRGVLNEKADAFYQQLEPQQQRLMEWLMVELTQVGDGQDDTRRTVTLQELHNRQPQYTEALDVLLVQLVTHERLLTQDHDDHGQATITVAHEALIRDWQRLREWLASNREIKSWRMRLEHDIVDWQKSGGSLLRDGRLAEAGEMLARNSDSFLIGQQERKFILSSSKQQQQEQEELLLRQQELREALQKAEKQAKIALLGKLSSQSGLAMRSPSLANGYVAQGLLLAVQAFHLDAHSATVQAALNDSLKLSGHLWRIGYGHTGTVNAIAFSPNGKYLVSASNDSTLRLWDAKTGLSIGDSWYGHKYNGYEKAVTLVAFSPDGQYVVSWGDDYMLCWWDVPTGQLITCCEYPGAINAMTFSPNGRVMVTGGTTTLVWWDAMLGILIDESQCGEQANIHAIAFSPDGNFLISAGDDETLWLWDTATRCPIGKPWDSHEDRINAVVFSPNGQRVVSASDDKTLCLWDVKTGQLIGRPWQGHKNAVSDVAFSPDGQRVVSSSHDGALRWWDVDKGQPIGEPWLGHEHSVLTAVAFSPNGQYVVSASSDKTLRWWAIEIQQSIEIQWSSHNDMVYPIAFSLDCRYMIGSNGYDSLALWDVKTGRLINNQKGAVTGAFSSDGKYVVSGSRDNTLQMWDVKMKKRIGEPWQGHEESVTTVAFSPNGKFVVSGSADKTLHLWDVEMKKRIGEPWQEHEKGVSAVAFSPNGKFVVSGGYDNTLRLWDVDAGKPIGKAWQGHKDYVNTIVFSPNGKRVVSSSDDGTLLLWNIETGESVGEPWHGHEASVYTVVFSPNGELVVSGSADKTLRLWDVRTGQPVGEPWQGHENHVSSVAFSLDGKFVISGGGDNTVRRWDSDPESWAKKACAIVNRNFSLAEWQRFIGDALPYEKTCPDLPAPGEEGWVEPYAGG